MKKTLAIIITAILTLTLFTACVANKPDKTISDNPPTEKQTAVQDETKINMNEETSAETGQKKEKLPTEKYVPTTKKEQENKIDKNKDNSHKTEKSTAHTHKSTTPAVDGDLNVISAKKVKETVLAHANLKESDVNFYHAEIDRERKTIVYEVEFVSGKHE